MKQTPRTDQRAADRFGVALPITMEGEEGATHDLSAGGILFESPSDAVLGEQVTVQLQYRRHGIDHQLDCKGRVVRVERCGDGYNIAVQLNQPLFGETEVARAG
ncbi:PilZ domain-containing protein [Ramlibacter tataouinensis]|uniref:PilZ domain-containing protein n=1 Tax=Ramlibacter tataouinensis (strain ATCC BAA-407 / DSM 14655 / LMG 21543 / TTB310) TaxID=365046 RepID=F5Y6B7_RAMTT|nr:PilZ domain-containing protein [Ramlibacter tataouinensis]AEG92803.1 hypothetical protein Rta_17130 [Ramlibacter tataouinensis TTB310]